DRCDKCRGEFYDVGEFDSHLELDREARSWLNQNRAPVRHDGPGGRALKCPGCRGDMDTFRVSGNAPVTIDICPACEGTWVDAGELALLKTAARARIVPKADGPVREPPPPGRSRHGESVAPAPAAEEAHER